MYFKLFLGLSLLFSPFIDTSDTFRTYHREYYGNGSLKSEGWLKGGAKSEYWRYYHLNGRISKKGFHRNNRREGYWYFYNAHGKRSEEGHYEKDKKVNWWLFYDDEGNINHKCQLNDGRKDGYCLKYRNEKLSSAAKYSNGKKIKEWYSFRSFKRENNLSDLK